jgi:hypothetical protein
MNSGLPRNWTGRNTYDLVVGPVALVCANLIDLFLATRVFLSPDRLAGSLAFFIFGAASGVPLQLALSRSMLAARLEGPAPSGGGRCNRKAAALAGVLGAVSTAAWLYCLAAAEPAVIFPLANFTPVVFALIEGARGHVSFRRVAAPLAVLLAGFWGMRTPGVAAFLTITPAVVLALFARNAASASGEALERVGADGRISRFSALRFAWLAGAGVPIAIVVAVVTGRAATCAKLIAENWKLALFMHAITMLLTFVGVFFRTRAKGDKPLTLCTAAYSTPLVVAPTVALLVNLVVVGFFPTVTASMRVLPCAALVVAGVAWLAASCRPVARPVAATVRQPRISDHNKGAH